MSGKLTAVVLMLCLLWQGGASAQIRTVSEAQLDSMANPVLAKQWRLMDFAVRSIRDDKLKENDAPVYEFEFVNRWDKTLSVTMVSSSCGCVKAVCEPRVIRPGDKGKVKATYYTAGHSGSFLQRIFVYTSLSEKQPTAVLNLDVTIAAGEDRSKWFPHQLGRIRTKVVEHSFRRDMREVVCLGFMNVGHTPLTLKFENALLPPCIKAWCETPDVLPGGEGEFCISFDPELCDKEGILRVPLIIKGLGVAPSASAIMLIIE